MAARSQPYGWGLAPRSGRACSVDALEGYVVRRARRLDCQQDCRRKARAGQRHGGTDVGIASSREGHRRCRAAQRPIARRGRSPARRSRHLARAGDS